MTSPYPHNPALPLHPPIHPKVNQVSGILCMRSLTSNMLPAYIPPCAKLNTHILCRPHTGCGVFVMSRPRIGANCFSMLAHVTLSISRGPCHITSMGSLLLWCSLST